MLLKSSVSEKWLRPVIDHDSHTIHHSQVAMIKGSLHAARVLAPVGAPGSTLAFFICGGSHGTCAKRTFFVRI